MNFILSKAKQFMSSLKTQEPKQALAIRCINSSVQQEDKTKHKEIAVLRKENIWSGKECALLIVAIEDIYFERKQRTNVIAELSSKLRSMGRANGINVGDLYRNEAGITLQMLKMEFLLTEGKKGLSGASKAFENIYNLYKTDINAFNKEFHLESKGWFNFHNSITFQNKAYENNLQNIEKLHSQDIDTENKKIQEIPSYIAKTDLRKTDLSVRLKNVIINNNFHTVEDLLSFGINAFSKLHNVGENTTQELEKFFLKLGINIHQPYKIIETSTNSENVQIDFSALLTKIEVFETNLRKDEKKWDVYLYRILNQKEKTLQELANMHSLTRERVRQIESSLIRYIINVQHPFECVVQTLFKKYGSLVSFKKAPELKKLLPYITIFYISSSFNKNAEYKVDPIENILIQKDLDFNEMMNVSSIHKEISEVEVSQFFKEQIHRYVIEDAQKPETSENFNEVLHYVISKSVANNFIYDNNTHMYFPLKRNVGEKELPNTEIISDKWHQFDNTIKDYLSSIHQHSVSPQNINVGNEQVEICDEDGLYIKFRKVLISQYKKGFRLDSHIEKQRFKIFYQQIHGETIPDNISETIIDQLIKKSGIVYENIVYVPDNMLDQETRDDLLSYIENSFENGCDLIYFTALYDEFSDKFLTQSILNSDMLKEYLSYINVGKYCIFKEYVAKDKEAKGSVKQEIIKLYLDHPEPFSLTDIYSSLPHIDKSKILQELRTSSDFISNGREQYFLADNFNVSKEDIEKLKELISALLDASTTHFITAAEMMALIHNRMPSLFENNGFLSELGIRNAISQLLKNDFCFNSNVISERNSNVELNDVFEDFAKNNSNFSLNELKNLASDFSSSIYFDAINKYSVRINKDEFISKNQLSFDSKEVDNAISLFCLDDYTPIQSITTFASFPITSYKWNPFLLESYLLNYSNEFELFRHGSCETKVAGVIVRKKSSYNSFNDVLIDAIAKSKCRLEKNDALCFLCEQGYIARRRYSSINSVIDKARIVRNLKG